MDATAVSVSKMLNTLKEEGLFLQVFNMEKIRSSENKKGILMIPFLLVFCILGAVVFFLSQRIYK